jgi:hypothetical protein
VSSGEGEWRTSKTDVLPGVAAADAEVAVAGFPAGCADCPLGCGSGDAEVEAEAETWFVPAASSSVFSSSDNMVFATLVISFINVISPIYKARESTRLLKYKPEIGAHVIHETLATKDVGEEAGGILDVRSTLGADHLLPILVIHYPKVLPNRAATKTQHQLRLAGSQIGDKRGRRTESESTRYASLVQGKG